MPIILPSEEDWRILRRILAKIDSVNGPGVTNAPDSININPPRGPAAAPPTRLQPRQFFLAKLTGSASLATNRWKYAWTEVRRDADLVSAVTDGRSGTTTTDYAVNLAEMYHTATYAWGVDVTSDDYTAAAFVVQPVGGGGETAAHRYDVVVEMEQVTDTNGDIKYQFHAFGSHDGACS